MRKLTFLATLVVVSLIFFYVLIQSLPAYGVGAFATPWFPVYLMKGPSQAVQIHEWCHVYRIRKMGALRFYWNYFTDSRFACAEEKACDFGHVKAVCTP